MKKKGCIGCLIGCICAQGILVFLVLLFLFSSCYTPPDFHNDRYGIDAVEKRIPLVYPYEIREFLGGVSIVNFQYSEPIVSYEKIEYDHPDMLDRVHEFGIKGGFLFGINEKNDDNFHGDKEYFYFLYKMDGTNVERFVDFFALSNRVHASGMDITFGDLKSFEENWELYWKGRDREEGQAEKKRGITQDRGDKRVMENSPAREKVSRKDAKRRTQL